MASKLVQSGRSDYSGASGESPTKAQPALKGTVVSSIFILLTTCIGAGTLSLPYAFSQGGIFVFSIIFFLIMVSECDLALAGALRSQNNNIGRAAPSMWTLP